MIEKIESYPHSAAASWSGFVYQGHVALYHSICALINGKSFQLQLDSIEDFSILQNSIADSVHQVKSLANQKRDDYIEALEGVGNKTVMCNESTIRYLHVSVEVDDCSPYVSSSGNVVSFYSYGRDYFCPIHRIESAIKFKIHEFLNLNGLVSTSHLIDMKFEKLVNKVCSQVLYIHALSQDELMTVKEAAYRECIKSDFIVSALREEASFSDDALYKAYKAKNIFNIMFGKYMEVMASDCKSEEYRRIVDVYKYIKSINEFAFEKLWKSVNIGAYGDELDGGSVADYIDILREIAKSPELCDVPHYINKNKEFYLPTAISAGGAYKETIFSESLLEKIKSDSVLFDVLVEYDKLISSNSKSFTPIDKYCTHKNINRNAVEDEYEKAIGERARITKAFTARIVSKEDAVRELSDE